MFRLWGVPVISQSSPTKAWLGGLVWPELSTFEHYISRSIHRLEMKK